MKKHKTGKTIKNTYLTKTIENTDIADIKSVIIEYLKNLHKLSNVMKQAENISTSEWCWQKI